MANNGSFNNGGGGCFGNQSNQGSSSNNSNGSSGSSGSGGSSNSSQALWNESTFMQTVPPYLRNDPDIQDLAAQFRRATEVHQQLQRELRERLPQ